MKLKEFEEQCVNEGVYGEALAFFFSSVWII